MELFSIRIQRTFQLVSTYKGYCRSHNLLCKLRLPFPTTFLLYERNLWVFWRTWETAAVLVFYIIAETPKYSQL